MSNNTIGERIKILRELKEMSQESLATTLGVARQTIGYYESGKRLPDSEFIIALCNFFSCTSDYLLGLSEIQTQHERYDIEDEIDLLRKMSSDIPKEGRLIVYGTLRGVLELFKGVESLPTHYTFMTILVSLRDLMGSCLETLRIASRLKQVVELEEELSESLPLYIHEELDNTSKRTLEAVDRLNKEVEGHFLFKYKQVTGFELNMQLSPEAHLRIKELVSEINKACE